MRGLNLLRPSARVADSGFVASLPCSRPKDQQLKAPLRTGLRESWKSFELGSIVARLSDAGRRMAIANERRRGRNRIASGAYEETSLATLSKPLSHAPSPPVALIPKRTLHSAPRTCQQLETTSRHGGASRRVAPHPTDCASARPVHPPPHQDTTAPHPAARAGRIGSGAERHGRASTYLSILEARAAKAMEAAVPASKDCNAAAEAAPSTYGLGARCLSDALVRVDFVSPVRKGFQNNTAEYVAMLLRYAKVQEARSPSFRRKSPPPICIPAKAA